MDHVSAHLPCCAPGRPFGSDFGSSAGPFWALLGASGSLGRSWAAPGPSRDWAVLGRSREPLGPLWVALGSLLGPPWPLLTSLGLSWAPLGPLLGLLWGLWGRSWKANATLRSLIKTMGFHWFLQVFRAPGTLPGPPGGLLAGPVASWRLLGGSWAVLKWSWVALGAKLGRLKWV